MLRSLQINNYALIDEMEISFRNGLTTITGETGAGKSILLGALSLILGSRADITVMKNKEVKCVVEGIFDYDDDLLNSILSGNDIEKDDLLIMRREINPNGKSRAFINDTPVHLPVLREIGIKLVDIHSQHENLELNSNHYQLMVVDAYAGLLPDISAYRKQYAKMKQIINDLSILREQADSAGKEIDFLTFQHKELEEAGISEGEPEELETELDVLRHAEEIKGGLFTVWNRISGEENNVVNLLKSVVTVLSGIKDYHKPSAELLQRVESLIIELKDISDEAESVGEKIMLDQNRLQIVQDRINLLYSLLHKHRVKTVTELIALRTELEKKIRQIGSMEFKIGDLERQLLENRRITKEMAGKLSECRLKNFPAVEKRIVEILIQLGMPNARFQIMNDKSGEPGENGYDNVRFLFTANKKTELQDISRIASGGELSRLMLGIKYIISGSTGLPTLIFDEIDTGVSGEIAYKVGSIMKDISVSRQVFSITHLPQVAAKGEQHLLVYKEESESGTTTRIRILNRDERIVEIARMLSGEQTTGAAMENARELLGS